MEVRYSAGQNGFKKFTTDELRKSFLIENLFQKNTIPIVYSDIDRSITGSAVPSGSALKLVAEKKENNSIPLFQCFQLFKWERCYCRWWLDGKIKAGIN